MARFIYTSCIGTFLFDGEKLLKELLFHDVIKANEALERGEWLPEEKKLAGSEKVLFLGLKNEKLPNVAFTSDLRKLEIARQKLGNHDAKIREALLKIAKKKIKDSVEGDELVTQAVSAVIEIDKMLSMAVKRLREWHGLKNPELAAMTEDNERFVKELLEGSGKSEMGAELEKEDLEPITALAQQAASLMKLRTEQEKYVEEKMRKVCPNVIAVTGPMIGGKLLTSAGSLKSLAMMPASKLQILGAERSMFNYLRKKSKKMPRFGILHEHKLIAGAPEREKGKAARLIADKITIAARVDYFKGNFIGDKLNADIDARLK